MTTTKKAADEPSRPEPLYEVLSRTPLGHETVHRLRAKDAVAARAAVIDGGVPESQVVEVVQAG